jgi:hypothetical protein
MRGPKYCIQVPKSSLTLETSSPVKKANRRCGHARPPVPLCFLGPIVGLVYRGGGLYRHEYEMNTVLF